MRLPARTCSFIQSAQRVVPVNYVAIAWKNNNEGRAPPPLTPLRPARLVDHLEVVHAAIADGTEAYVRNRQIAPASVARRIILPQAGLRSIPLHAHFAETRTGMTTVPFAMSARCDDCHGLMGTFLLLRPNQPRRRSVHARWTRRCGALQAQNRSSTRVPLGYIGAQEAMPLLANVSCLRMPKGRRIFEAVSASHRALPPFTHTHVHLLHRVPMLVWNFTIPGIHRKGMSIPCAPCSRIGYVVALCRATTLVASIPF